MTDPKERIDYEKLTPGPTGYYRNLSAYPDIIEGWSDQDLVEQFDTAAQLLAVSDPPMPTNSLRVTFIIDARRKMRSELLRRMDPRSSVSST